MPRRDLTRRYRVRIDGDPSGDLLRGQERAFSVPPGPHRIQVSMGPWLRSRAQSVELQPGEVIDFECRPHGSSILRVLAAIAPWWYLVLDGPLHDD